MIDYEIEQWNAQPELRAVVAAYSAATFEAKLASSQSVQALETKTSEAAIPSDESQDSNGEAADDEDSGSSKTDARWIARLTEVEGIEPERLSRIHGQLIALGFLKFRLADRHSGVYYQVTSQATRLLTRILEVDEAEVEPEVEEVAS